MDKFSKILVLGAGPVKIGQSLEFDYSALQMCRALKEEGIKVVFANPTPSALATDKSYADKVYIEPLNIESVKRILKREKPDGLLPSVSGDDGLELSLELSQNGYLDETDTVLLGVDSDVIRSVKNRHSFNEALQKTDEPSVPTLVVNSCEEACDFADKVGYPVIVRPAYTPDRESAEFCYTREQLLKKADKSLEDSIVSQIMIEKSIAGWKEIEFEVVRDSEDNCIAVSSVENIDAVGIHTGDSIAVIPAQTLTSAQNEMLTSAAKKIASDFGVEGSCNVQFALRPDGEKYFVTGIDPRVSRTSALVSKATGYEIAYVSAKIALGKTLKEIKNGTNLPMSQCAVKFPKWSFESFGGARRRLGTLMQATGECLALGDNFETAFIKGVRSVNKNSSPRLEVFENLSDDELKAIIGEADDRRIFAVYEAVYRDFSLDELNALTSIDKWFLERLKYISDAEKSLKTYNSPEAYKQAENMGFTRRAVCEITGEEYVDAQNVDLSLDSKTVLVVGSGPTVTGRGGDNDYCTVHCINSLKKQGFKVAVLNNNPASVTTDFTVADKVYIAPLTTEDILDIVNIEKPQYAVLMFGGEDAIKKTEALKSAGVEIIGADFELYRKLTNKIEFFDILDYANVKHTGSRKLCVGTCIEAHVISDGGDFYVPALCEHIEKAHINSGDSITVTPTVSVSSQMEETVLEYIKNITEELSVKGAFDLQFVIFDNDLYVTKASVTSTALVPFLSKATGTDIVDIAMRCAMGEKLKDMGVATGVICKSRKFCVRVPVFSFEQLKGADMLLDDKTKSTGDVMGIGDTFDNALLKGLIASGMRIKRTGSVLISVRESDKSETLKTAQEFLSQGFRIYATSDTAKILNANHIATSTAMGENAVQMINSNKFSYVISTLENSRENYENAMIRHAALMKRVPVFTSVESAYTFSKSLANNNVMEEMEVKDI